MIELWTVLTPILLVDMVNPVLFAFLVYAVGSDRPVINSTSLLLGHTAAYLIAGFAIALGLGELEARLAAPKPVDFVSETFRYISKIVLNAGRCICISNTALS